MKSVIVLIGADGRARPAPEGFGFEDAQEYVGGLVQVVWMDDGWAMLLNEEGKLDALPRNPFATELVGGYLLRGDWIAGNAILLDPSGVSAVLGEM